MNPYRKQDAKGFCPCEATHAKGDASNTVWEP